MQFQHGMHQGKPLGKLKPAVTVTDNEEINGDGDAKTWLDYMSTNVWSYVGVAIAGCAIIGIVVLWAHWFVN